MAKIKKETASAEPSKIVFSKSKILTFTRYAKRADLLDILLKDDRQYSLAEADALIESFMKGQVK